MGTTRSDLDCQSIQVEGRPRDTQLIRGVIVVSDDTVCKNGKALAPLSSRKKIWGKKKSPL